MKRSLKETTHFDREGFSGDVYVSNEESLGFNVLQVTVRGRHPRKRMIDTTRVYLVREGSGKFVIDGVEYVATSDDLFIVPPGSDYEYEGEMLLFEFNVSPENSFKDEIL